MATEPARQVSKSDAEWREQLDDFSYRVLREAATERAFTGEFWDHHEFGTYRCKGCGVELFDSDSKYDSGCGWPSFHSPAEASRIEEKRDLTHGMIRTEVLCRSCGGHLGHVFPDGPQPTGLRYCINSASLTFGDAGKD